MDDCEPDGAAPLVDRYLTRLEEELARRGFRGALRLMHFGGRPVSPAAAAPRPRRRRVCGLPDERRLHRPGGAVAISLDASARAVLELDVGRRSLAAIAEALAAPCAASAADLQGDVGDVVRERVRPEALEGPRASRLPGPGA